MHAPTSCRLLAPDEDRSRIRVVTDVDGYEYECPDLTARKNEITGSGTTNQIVVTNPPTSVWSDPLFAPSPPVLYRSHR